jgi:hypothetical protein
MSYHVSRSSSAHGDGVDDDNASSVDSEDSGPRVVAPWAGRAGVKGYHRAKGSGAVREAIDDVQVRFKLSPLACSRCISKRARCRHWESQP